MRATEHATLAANPNRERLSATSVASGLAVFETFGMRRDIVGSRRIFVPSAFVDGLVERENSAEGGSRDGEADVKMPVREGGQQRMRHGLFSPSAAKVLKVRASTASEEDLSRVARR